MGTSALQSLLSFQWPSRLLFLRAILVVIGGFLVHLSLGTIYTFGNIAPYIVSYVRNQSHPTNLRQETTTWIFACALMGQGGAMFLGGWLVKKIGPRWTTLIGGWTMSLGVCLSYITIKFSFYLLLVTYGLLFGVGVGIAYIGPLSSAMNWMPKWKGLANGVVVAGFGFGALIFNAVQTTFINPKNLKIVKDQNGDAYFTDPDLLFRVPKIFLILGGTYAVMQLFGSLLITNPPEDYNTQTTEDSSEIVNSGSYKEVDDNSVIINTSKKADSTTAINKQPKSTVPQLNGFTGETDKQADSQEKVKLLTNNGHIYSDSDEERLSTRQGLESSTTSSTVSWGTNVVTSLLPLQMLKKPGFYLLWSMFLLNGLAVIFVATLYKFFAQGFIDDDHFLASVGSVAAIFNCSGRIIWGVIADKVSYKFALVLLSGLMTMFMLTLYACILGGKVMFFIWMCIIFFCVGGNFSLFPTAVGRAFGLHYVSINYGLLFTSQVLAGSLGALLSTFLKTRIGFVGLFFLVSGLTSVSFLLAIFYKPKRYLSLQPKK